MFQRVLNDDAVERLLTSSSQSQGLYSLHIYIGQSSNK